MVAKKKKSPYGTKKEQTRNRTHENTETPSKIKARREARMGGRNPNSAYSAGTGRTQQTFGTRPDGTTRSGQRAVTEIEGMRRAWANNENVRTATSSRTGRMSDNGRTAGGMTWTFSDKDNRRQSGRSTISNRRVRYGDVRNSFNDNSREELGRRLLNDGRITRDEFNSIYRTSGGGSARGLTTG